MANRLTILILHFALSVAALLYAPATMAQQNTTLPDYVIDQFGPPPSVPDGPLPDALKAAVQTAFIDSMAQSA